MQTEIAFIYSTGVEPNTNLPYRRQSGHYNLQRQIAPLRDTSNARTAARRKSSPAKNCQTPSPLTKGFTPDSRALIRPTPRIIFDTPVSLTWYPELRVEIVKCGEGLTPR